MAFKVETIRKVKLGEIYLGSMRDEERVVQAMHSMMVLCTTGEHRDRKDIPRQDFGPVVAWVFDQLPRTIVKFEPTEYEWDYAIVAYFESETDATAFKTRWG